MQAASFLSDGRQGVVWYPLKLRQTLRAISDIPCWLQMLSSWACHTPPLDHALTPEAPDGLKRDQCWRRGHNLTTRSPPPWLLRWLRGAYCERIL
jgi:hypothetical protein